MPEISFRFPNAASLPEICRTPALYFHYYPPRRLPEISFTFPNSAFLPEICRTPA